MWEFLAKTAPGWLLLLGCWWYTCRRRRAPESPPPRRQLPGEQHVQEVAGASDYAGVQSLVALLKAQDIPALPRVEEGEVRFSSWHAPARTLKWSVVVPNADAVRARVALTAAGVLEPQGPVSPAEVAGALVDEEDEEDEEDDEDEDNGDDPSDAPDLGMQAALWFGRVVVGATALLIVVVVLRLVFRW